MALRPSRITRRTECFDCQRTRPLECEREAHESPQTIAFDCSKEPRLKVDLSRADERATVRTPWSEIYGLRNRCSTDRAEEEAGIGLRPPGCREASRAFGKGEEAKYEKAASGISRAASERRSCGVRRVPRYASFHEDRADCPNLLCPRAQDGLRANRGSRLSDRSASSAGRSG